MVQEHTAHVAKPPTDSSNAGGLPRLAAAAPHQRLVHALLASNGRVRRKQPSECTAAPGSASAGQPLARCAIPTATLTWSNRLPHALLALLPHNTLHVSEIGITGGERRTLAGAAAALG